MKLYYVKHDDDDGNNFDLFVVAESAIGAIALWNQYYELEGATPESVTRAPDPTAFKAATAIDWATLERAEF